MRDTVCRWGRRVAALACVALLVAGPLAAQAEGWGKVATGRSGRMDQAFTCTADPGVEAAQREMICAGFLAVLVQSYPKVAFGRSTGGPGVELRILRASATGATLHLIWTDAAGRVTAGREAGLSVMDHAMTVPMLDKLFRRMLAETPMP